MVILRIEHPAPDFDRWKAAFDGDPVGRRRSGVRTHRVMRAVDDPNYVMIDLEFDGKGEAEAMLGALRELWRQAEGNVMQNPQARIVEVVESQDY